MPSEDTVPSSGETRRFCSPHSTVSLSSGTHQDEPEEAGVPLPAPPPQNPSPAIVRGVQPALAENLAGIHRAAAMIADLYILVSVDALALKTPAHRLVEIARLVARDGMRASRLLKKAAKEVR